MLDQGLHIGLDHLGLSGRTVAYVEWEAYAAAQLIALMEAKCLDEAPVWCGDLARFPSEDFRGKVDCIIAGFPCQPHSVAGKRKGLNDDRWIWPDIMRIIRESGAWCVFLENVPGLATTGGLAACLADLAKTGFDAEWSTLSAAQVGASHKRERLFILAHSPSLRLKRYSANNGTRQDQSRVSQPVPRSDEMAHARHGSRTLQHVNRLGQQATNDSVSGEVVEYASSAMRGTLPSENEAQVAICSKSSGDVCNAYVSDAQGRQHQQYDAQRRPYAVGSARLSNRELFAPSPNNTEWANIIATSPHLAPATELGVCGMVNGLSVVVDESRRHQLRAIGNGVVATTAACAFVKLAERGNLI